MFHANGNAARSAAGYSFVWPPSLQHLIHGAHNSTADGAESIITQKKKKKI